ncbi:MAG: hypothetical protein ACRCU0_00745 [Candidatus Rhabdochlamydia sp.]
MTTPVSPGSSHIFFITSAPSTPPQLSAEEKKYVEQLVLIMPLDSILTDEKVERECKDLGQKIFDKVKAAHDSFAAKDAVKGYHVGFQRQSCAQIVKQSSLVMLQSSIQERLHP